MSDVKEREASIDAVRFWWHSIDFGQGLVSPGKKNSSLLEAEYRQLELPDLASKSVLDIGAWDGYFSFRCEADGAASVTALDHFVWSIDLPEFNLYRDRCIAQGRKPDLYENLPEIWRPNDMPGRIGFDTASSLLNSAVKPVTADFMEMDLAEIGTFDIVLYLGVLYHIKDPFLALRRLAATTREMAVIETEAIHVPGLEDHALLEFYETDELNNDPSNWFCPTEKSLVGLCRAAGFSDVRVITRPPRIPSSSIPKSKWKRLFSSIASEADNISPVHYRLVVQAFK